MKKLILIRAGGTFEDLRLECGDFEDWTIRGMGLETSSVRVVRISDGEPPPDPEKVSGVVMTGSHAMVTDREEWSERLCPWILRVVANSIPFLGICYGHQLLAKAFGGEVGNHPAGPEIGTVPIFLSGEACNDPLFGGLPASFPAHVTHTQSVLRLPAGARVLAVSDFEPYQAVAFGASAWGIQFHPEFDARAMRFYVEAQAGKLQSLGRDPAAIRDRVVETPVASGILVRFAHFIARKSR